MLLVLAVREADRGVLRELVCEHSCVALLVYLNLVDAVYLLLRLHLCRAVVLHSQSVKFACLVKLLLVVVEVGLLVGHIALAEELGEAVVVAVCSEVVVRVQLHNSVVVFAGSVVVEQLELLLANLAVVEDGVYQSNVVLVLKRVDISTSACHDKLVASLLIVHVLELLHTLVAVSAVAASVDGAVRVDSLIGEHLLRLQVVDEHGSWRIARRSDGEHTSAILLSGRELDVVNHVRAFKLGVVGRSALVHRRFEGERNRLVALEDDSSSVVVAGIHIVRLRYVCNLQQVL